MAIGLPCARTILDKHVGHASPTPNPFHKKPYTSGGQIFVSIEGQIAVVQGGSTGCGDKAVGGSALVTVGSTRKGLHRRTDGTSGHGSWVPNACASGSGFVRAS